MKRSEDSYLSRKFVLALVFALAGGVLSFHVADANFKVLSELLIGLYFIFCSGNVAAKYVLGKVPTNGTVPSNGNASPKALKTVDPAKPSPVLSKEGGD